MSCIDHYACACWQRKLDELRLERDRYRRALKRLATAPHSIQNVPVVRAALQPQGGGRR